MQRLKLESLKSALLRETYALPIDLFRVAVGFMCIFYFLRLLLEAADFSAGDGLIDHELSFEILWFTQLTLLGTWVSTPMLYSLLVFGLLASVSIMLGWRPKLCAFYILVLTVSHSRRNFLVLSVDDCSIYLLMFWLLLMPIGNTMVVGQYLKDKSCLKEWAALRVPGATMRLFLANITLYYFTVGLSKLISPLWRDGYAVYAVLQMPISRSYGMWGEEHLPFLWFLNHLTLLVECALALLPLLPKWNHWKWPLLLSAIGCHVSIVTLIGVPYVNGTMVIAMILVFRHEIMDTLRKRWSLSSESEPFSSGRFDLKVKIASIFLVMISIIGTKGVPVLGQLYKPGVAALYVCGLAQDYHLFDWIDKFNYQIENQVKLIKDGEESLVSDKELFPLNIRGKILQSYIHHMRWMPISPAFSGELRRSILERAAQRFARRNPGEGRVEVTVLVQRIDHRNLSVDKPQLRPLMVFSYKDGVATMEEPY